MLTSAVLVVTQGILACFIAHTQVRLHKDTAQTLLATYPQALVTIAVNSKPQHKLWCAHALRADVSTLSWRLGSEIYRGILRLYTLGVVRLLVLAV